ncbi:MarR family winged helix-turn-helix transcriptional regulator [Arthrobacter sp. B3I4]|uniref:MarR family winged helix-turn-helix transcriptional regulator n=1 Tax=Arthrobacter sp. B3I4 TaxID=3042267 RepID=UPI0027884F81|nr:MarR family transcriptional regulator [Arthrobacter sp. B3I4]MDQ0754362.1 DNA-binding MarR family transcriptional regulator [Arthrobacter sp. B3I4]
MSDAVTAGPADAAQVEEDLLLERQLCFALTVASRSVVGAYKPVLDRLGLTHPQYLVMLCLWERSPRTVRDISNALALEPATISPLLRRLEAAGYITRERAEGNERSLAVGLTSSGADLRQQATAVPGAMMARLGLDREQVGELHAAMMRLIAATRLPDPGAAAFPAPAPPADDSAPGSTGRPQSNRPIPVVRR